MFSYRTMTLLNLFGSTVRGFPLQFIRKLTSAFLPSEAHLFSLLSSHYDSTQKFNFSLGNVA